MKDDVIVIGGGAAGLCAAVAVKQQAPGLSVRLLEALPRVGKKLSVTGNGRCNITNRTVTTASYHGRRPEFASYALDRFDNTVCEAFFARLGLPFVYEGEKAYPASLQAASVTDCLRFALEELGVMVCTETRVTNIQLSGGGYKVIAGKVSFFADRVIVAAGLLSGGEAYGCTGDILALLKKSGFAVVPTHPAIVQVKTATDVVRQLKGIKVNANVSLFAGERLLRREFGETLFCDYGLSGPPVLQVSGAVAETDAPKHIELDLMPRTDLSALQADLTARAALLSHRRLEEFFTGMLQKRLGQVVLKCAGLSLSDKGSSLHEAEIARIAHTLKHFRFAVTGTTGFANSQVTAGGLDTAGFDPNTMMSRQSPGLYAIGEILDIDGDCGGFNLRWAWSSALCAAADIVRSATC